MAMHDNSHESGQQYCDHLFELVNRELPDLRREKKTSCGLFRAGENRFAYVYHKKATPSLRIYFRGDAEVIPKSDLPFGIETRPNPTNPWEKTFPHFFNVTDNSSAEKVAQFLLTYAVPLSLKIRRATTRQESANGFEEIANPSELHEGMIKSVVANMYERNEIARKLCIKAYGCQCFICNFDFAKAYGEVGIDYIQVHHLRPLASIGHDYVVNPITDLRPVCANCHAIIHRFDPPLDCERVVELIQNGLYSSKIESTPRADTAG